MKKEHIKVIFEKYKNGQTSLEEEQFLLENANDLNSPLSHWVSFKKETKKKVPENFNETLWQSFDKKTKPKIKLVKRVLLVAASIVLLVALFPRNNQENTQSFWEKEALLLEAKSMFSEIEKNKNQDIVFEDDLITIYTTNK